MKRSHHPHLEKFCKSVVAVFLNTVSVTIEVCI